METVDGTEVNAVSELEIGGRKFILIDPGVPRYINNVLVRYLVCPSSQFVRDVGNQVDVIKENENEVRNSESEDESVLRDI